MKKLAIFFTLPLFAFLTADWVTVALDNRVSLDFPTQASIIDLSGRKSWQDTSNYDAKCVAVIFDFGELNMDSAAVAAEMSKSTALDEFVNGALENMPGASLISKAQSLTEGRVSFEAVYNLGESKSGRSYDKMYNKNVFVADKMYVLYFYERKQKPQDEIRKRFFGSFRLK